MIRALYSLALRLAQPLLRRKLARRAVAEPGYALAVEERFGRYSLPRDAGGRLWIHAVSLGETRAAAILLAELRRQRPGLRLLLTHGTATGRAEGEKLLQPGDLQVWQPWDTPEAVRRFLDHFRPAVGVLMETEVWPNLVAACRQRGLPLMLANARLNARSLAGAQRLAPLSGPAYAALAAVWAQTEADAQRLRLLGAPLAGVFGNLKFDATPDAGQLAQGRAWRARGQRPVVMFASSREGEEALFLEQFRAAGQSVQLLIVPRHPQRFDEVAQLVAQQGLSLARRSAWGESPAEADVWLGDSLGEMALYYGLAELALLGGSFAPLGGQNLIEAAACGCPVIMGPHTFNFAEAAELARSAGAAWQVADMAAAREAALALLGDAPRHQAAQAAATAFAAAHRGAAAKTAQALLALLDQAAA
ncbi:3-deoxy-D-manno-octulosonic acid transferase [Ramlibacter sp. 2FC]|uniref:3-deoxy-D-manno-octulosonic acid transferase n=1 Tax=Ramlibacter sp. 2FC TaxID=2502188 RepID=UPI0010F5FBB7|nr:3-deoxy-D-manno-octulosonic acid transferase [Ramlibacter sp. 2FC]